MARSGFKLRSGNRMAGSSFKMMGASPAKSMDVFETTFDVDGNEVVERVGTGDKAVKAGIATEKANQRKRIANEKLKSDKLSEIQSKMVDMENANPDSMDFVNSAEYKALEQQRDDIKQGNFEGGLKQSKVTYTGDDAATRKGIGKGEKTTRSGTYPTKKEEILSSAEFGDKEKEDELIQQIKTAKEGTGSESNLNKLNKPG